MFNQENHDFRSICGLGSLSDTAR